MNNKEYCAAINNLSPIQLQAADWNEGPLLVLAGPGSGKTRVLTCRIARLLDESADQKYRILGLTFTNKAANEIRTRVASFVPGQEGRLFLGTFHSFCADVLRQQGIHLGINPNFTIYSHDADLEGIVADAVRETKKQFPIISELDKKLLPVIQRLKSMLVLPENCHGFIKDQDMAERVAIVYQEYENQLLKHNALDFNSLIFQAYKLFTKFPAIGKRFRTTYKFICIDEFQDTNSAQYKFIRALTGDTHKNLFIVADDDQIIYQWNGASHQRLEEFVKDFSPEVIQLPMNYRCPLEVVELANNLIKNNFLRTHDKQPLIAYRKGNNEEKIRLIEFGTDSEEAAGIAKDIQERHTENYGSVVVLARTRKLLDVAENALHNIGVPAIISQRKSDFDSVPLVWLHAALKLVNDKTDFKSLEALCGTFYQFGKIDIIPEAVLDQSPVSELGYLQNWMIMAKKEVQDEFLIKLLEMTTTVLINRRDYKTFSKNALDWFDEKIRTQSAAEESQTEIFPRYNEERAVWQNLILEIAKSLGDEVSLEAFLQEIEMHSKEPSVGPNTVVLMTIHGSKGKEFEHVYLMGLVEDELPSFQSRSKGERSPELEEERRNCFVAITRTIKTLTITYANQYKRWSKKPSRFLYEMGLLQSNN